MMSGIQRFHIWPDPSELDLLVEQGHHRHWIGHAAVDTRQRDDAVAAYGFDRRVERGKPIESGLLHRRLGDSKGRCAVTRWANAAPGEPCASIPTASITESGPRPSVSSRAPREEIDLREHEMIRVHR
jgi:hypothetical protein